MNPQNSDRKLPLPVVTAIPDNTATVLLAGRRLFLRAVEYPAGQSTESPASVAIEDLNGDGNNDLAVANGGTNTVSVLLGDGDGTFQAHVEYATGTDPTVAIDDLNNGWQPGPRHR